MVAIGIVIDCIAARMRAFQKEPAAASRRLKFWEETSTANPRAASEPPDEPAMGEISISIAPCRDQADDARGAA